MTHLWLPEGISSRDKQPCTYHRVFFNCPLRSSCFFFFKLISSFLYLCTLCPSSKGPKKKKKKFFFFPYLETSPSKISAVTAIHITHYPGAAPSLLSVVDKYVALAWKRLVIITGDFSEWKHQRCLQTLTNWEQLEKIGSMKRREGKVVRKMEK